ncbi:MAG: UDP-N-acetylmuramoyl-tripeptide--D-alanyl-D-alanine ligase [Candidatus Blackburnbacteria bacterium]|nr:UDP-N-acetylmuramoyl-tripeptide--D-alanyl-D-alanine ligase [Candidatus Blackburnbacteria bacterium]
MSSIPKVIHWWVGSKLHPHYFIIPPERRPKGFYKLTRLYFRTWVVHPLKRRMARYYLKFLQTFFGLTVIAVTGSTGKTSTKEMIHTILAQKGESTRTAANIDPTFNIPSTILKCTPFTKYLVLEMGVEFPGEMDFYLWLAHPKVGIITNIYQTHTQFFGNLAGVAREKVKLVRVLPQNGFAVLNKENALTRKMGKAIKAKVIWFGNSAHVRAQKIQITKDLKTRFLLHINKESIEIELPLLGSQFVDNALAAATVGHVFGANLKEIKKGLENFETPEHRMRPIKLKNGAIILDDSYNSNPAAAKAALETLKKVAGSKKMIVVMGDMLELGKEEIERHKELGKTISEMSAVYLIAVGPLAKNIATEGKKAKMTDVWWVGSQEEVLPVLKPILAKDSVALVKGSRSVGLDKLVDRLVI